MSRPTDQTCCVDFERARNMSRRTFISGVGGGLLATLMSTDEVFAQAAFADTTASSGNVVVVLSQRGGCDGLSMLVPYADPAYYTARPTIGIPKSQLLAVDSMFGLHPKLKPLYGLWTGKQMAALTATGLPTANRSHFEAMAEVEDAAPGTSLRSGWINRTLGLGSTHAPTDGIQVGAVVLPDSLSGSAPAMSLANNQSIGFPGWMATNDAARNRYLNAMQALWNGSGTLASPVVADAFAVQQKLIPVAAQTYAPSGGASYPATPLGAALTQAAQLIKSNVGAQVITVDHGSWDFHANLGTLDTGLMSPAINEFATAVAAFVQDLGVATMAKVTIVTLTEFGRRVHENGNVGLDHGWGNTMWVLGAGVKGGKVYGTWPTLDPTALTNGDLKVTTDYRDLLAEIVSNRLGASASSVFPGYTPKALGMVGAS